MPGQRYRIEQWAPLLREEGIEVSFSPFLSPRGLDTLYQTGRLGAKTRNTFEGYLRRLAQTLRPREHDLAYVYRETALLAPAWLDLLFARRLPVVFDFDDAIYLPTASAPNSWAAALKSPRKVAALCRTARHVTVGNETLAAYARSHAGAVTVIPSTVDTAVYVPTPRPQNPRPVLGWTGSATTLPHLRTIGPALARLRRAVEFELRVVGGPMDLPGVDTSWVPWRAETEVRDLRAFDVGLMPLPDDEWSRGKCGMKALQYMALGIPPVVSPVGFNAALVSDGVNGLHAAGADQWISALTRLLRDPELRARLGAAARRTVEQGYTAQVQAPRMARVLRTAAS